MTAVIGQLAPDFTLPDDRGQKVTLSKLRGSNVVLYFYPKDSTATCTEQACDFRDAFNAMQEKNTVVYGISKDTMESHKEFKQKNKLPFTLLVDEQGDVCETYGVVDYTLPYGIARSTFLIDKNGILQIIWRKVAVKGHVEEIMNELT